MQHRANDSRQVNRNVSFPPAAASRGRGLEFSLFYFYSDTAEAAGGKYRLLIEGAKFADRNGFAAVWTPERHFHEFGGIYPNPSLTGAALATITNNIEIRAGSIVVPLHNPIRIAEEWSVVDNLSNGRAGLSIACGWHADDFIFAPEKYEHRKDEMVRSWNTIRSLWRGDAIVARNGAGKEVEVRIFPRPIQPELPLWITCSGGPDTFALAGELGGNVLTHLLGQDVDELAEKIDLYRETLARNEHDPESRRVTLMMHALVGESVEEVREKVRAPFSNYLASSLSLIKRQLGNSGGSTPWRKSAAAPGGSSASQSSAALTQTEQDELVSYAFERYFETAALFGTPETCLNTIERLKEIGVDEVACLIDFGVDAESVLEGLRHLNLLKELSNSPAAVSEDFDANHLIRGFNDELEMRAQC